MATNKTNMKVLKSLKEDSPVTISDIAKETGSSFSSVKNSIEFLNEIGEVDIISNGKTSLIKLKENQNE